MTYVWAYLAGILTLINPCVLPLLPITIAAALQSGRLGPVWLAAGLVGSFVTVGVGVTAFGHLAGIDQELITRFSAVLMMVFGVVLLVPRAQEWLARVASPVASQANARIAAAQPGEVKAPPGYGTQLFIGVLLGAVWSPCIGPTLGGAIGLAASGEGLAQATFTMLAFGVGVSSVLMALAYGSREVVGARRARMMSWMPWAKPVMGVILLLVGAALYFHWLRALEIWLLDVMPEWLLALSVSV